MIVRGAGETAFADRQEEARRIREMMQGALKIGLPEEKDAKQAKADGNIAARAAKAADVFQQQGVNKVPQSSLNLAEKTYADQFVRSEPIAEKNEKNDKSEKNEKNEKKASEAEEDKDSKNGKKADGKKWGITTIKVLCQETHKHDKTCPATYSYRESDTPE